MNNKTHSEQATFGGGCFWCMEAVFQRLKGVSTVISGYSGGSVHNPTYEQVCSGKTGHAESIQITFDPQQISFEALLDVFFHLHDPTTKNQQGNDIGTQYRSVIFYHSEEQKRITEQYIQKITNDHIYASPIVTEVIKYTMFYPAEGYHQDYFNKNSYQPYCQYVIDPKIQKLYKDYKSLLNKSQI